MSSDEITSTTPVALALQVQVPLQRFPDTGNNHFLKFTGIGGRG